MVGVYIMEAKVVMIAFGKEDDLKINNVGSIS
jgi:hypothetical protein